MRTILILLGILFFLPGAVLNAGSSPANDDSTVDVAGMKVTRYKLANGLTVILNEDHSQPTVFGCVVVRAGSKDEPADATGLAHYLEHVLFKGTQALGTTDWEAERPHFEKIVALYEELRATTDPAKKKEINALINEESIAAGKYAVPNEFSNLVQAMGGTGLNAATSYDYTMYHNSFPPFQVRRWLDLYAHRFVNPVFRGFQSELETVYEEKNMYADNPFQAVTSDFLANAFGAGNPYGRQIIGTTEHLKNPSIKSINEFYNAFYVPSNMALILSGDINPADVKAMIEETFGKWDSRNMGAQHTQPQGTGFSGTKTVKQKMTPYPVMLIGYPGVSQNHPDEHALTFCMRLLSNENRTGLFDNLVLEGDLLGVAAGMHSMKHGGLNMIQAIPSFDVAQMRYVPLANVEKMIGKEIEKLKKGEFDDWLVDAFKSELAREFDMMFESPMMAGYALMQGYAYDMTLDDLFGYKQKIQAVTKKDIIAAANKYFANDKLVYMSDMGSPKKETLPKPGHKPIEPAAGGKSAYAAHIEDIPLAGAHENFVDFGKDVRQAALAQGVKLFYTPNPANEVFTLTIKFGVGTGKMPSLGMATQLMSYAGIMAQYKPQELKKEYSRLGCSVDFTVTDSYLYITLSGDEKNLAEACQLLSRTFLLPQLDEKQLNNVKGGVLSSRTAEKKDKDSQASALYSYLQYSDNSPYITRLPNDKVRSLTISNLTGDFIRATQYETSVHYVGITPFDALKQTLTGNLALPSDLQKSDSPYIRPYTADTQESILFLDNPEARQSDVYLFIKGSEYKKDVQPVIDAFNQYFGGGFNGIVLQELRELRSFAYSAGAAYRVPPVEGKYACLVGSIGTQADKTADAVTEFMKLIRDMPSKPERLDNIQKYLVQASQSARPGFRDLSQSVEEWMRRGYTDDPNKLKIPGYEKLTFDNIMSFYGSEISGSPVQIAIVGNRKDIDMAKLEAVAKVVRINTSKIFKD